MGKDSKGNRLRDRFPLAVSFPHFFSVKRNGVARRRNALVLFPFPPAAGNPPSLCGFAACLCGSQLWSRRLRRASFFVRQRKSRKKPLKGTYFEAVPLRIPPRRPRGLRPPLDSPLLDGGRGFTKDEGQGCPLRRGREFGRRLFRSCGSDLLAQRGERRQRRARGDLSVSRQKRLTAPLKGSRFASLSGTAEGG